MKPLQHPVAFRMFLALWNGTQGQKTPGVHLCMADWLQERYVAGDRRLLLMAFRSCGKSTIVGVFAAWLLYANPDLRILVLAAEGTLARRMVRNVRRVVERHQLTRHLRPQDADQWAGERFTVARGLELRDPSMMARGIDANITGSRADIIICDDVEVPKTSATAERREGLREKLGELDFILAPGGSILYVGTPHSWYTIYADAVRSEIGEVDVFLKDYTRLEIPVLDADGNSAWPERYALEDIERMRLSTGVNKFSSQMMLVPTNILDGRLNPALLRRYEAEIDYTHQLDTMELCGRKLIASSAFWDPAVGGGDGSVLAIVFMDEGGHLWLHRVCYLHQGSNVDQGEMQAHQVATILEVNHIPAVSVETNGVGALLPEILQREINQRKIPCAVVKHHATVKKSTRILSAFQTLMEAGMLHVHESVYHTKFIREMQEWNPKKESMRDDGLDAVASAIALRPPIVKVGTPGGRLTWHGGGKTHRAKTEFEV